MCFCHHVLIVILGLFKHGLAICKAYLADITALKDRPAILGYFNAVSSMGFIFGPIIAGYLSDIDPTLKLTLTIGAIIFSLDFVFVLILLSPSKKDSSLEILPVKKAMRKNTWVICKWVHIGVCQFCTSLRGFHFREIADLITIQFLASLSMLIFRSNLPVFLEENFTISNATFGKLIAFSAVTTTLASATCGIVSKYYDNHSKHLLHFMVLLFVSLFVINISFSIIPVLFFLFTISLSSSNLRISMLSLLLVHGQEDEKGAIIGFSNSLSSIGRMVAPIVVGISQEAGSQFAGFISAAFAFLAFWGTVCFTIKGVGSNHGDATIRNRH